MNRKLVVILASCMILLVVTGFGVFAATDLSGLAPVENNITNNETINPDPVDPIPIDPNATIIEPPVDVGAIGDIRETIDIVLGVTNITRKYVEEFVLKKNINPERINNVSKIDFDSLPKEVNIENVNDANLAIYQISYNETEEEKNVYVITYSVEQLRAQGDLIIAHDKRSFLNFGFEGESAESLFLDTATGVSTSEEVGYVMMREGSLTGLSTNLEIIRAVKDAEIEVIIMKNGEPIGFGNTIDASTTGVKVDHDVQSKGTNTFVQGDVISIYLNAPNGVSWKNIITIVEITTTS